MTTITIRVHAVRVLDGDRDRGPHLRAVGYLPGGKVLIEGPVYRGHDVTAQATAVQEVAGWLRANRPGWNIATLPGEGVVEHEKSLKRQENKP